MLGLRLGRVPCNRGVERGSLRVVIHICIVKGGRLGNPIYCKCTLLNSTRNKGEVGSTPTKELALLPLVETEEIFSKEI